MDESWKEILQDHLKAVISILVWFKRGARIADEMMMQALKGLMKDANKGAGRKRRRKRKRNQSEMKAQEKIENDLDRLFS